MAKDQKQNINQRKQFTQSHKWRK